MAQNTAQAKQRTKRAHWSTGARWPRTPHKQNNQPNGHTGEQEPSGPEHRTHRQHIERAGERHHAVGKANRSTESDRTGRGAAHHAGPRGTPERHAAGYNKGTRTGAKQRQPPGAANPESAHNTQRTTARGQVPSNTSCRPDERVRPRQQTQHLRATEQPPSGWTRVRPEGTQLLPATNSRRSDGRVRARRVPSSCRLRKATVRMDE